MSSIGNRLETALDLLNEYGRSTSFADIGSDHAFLAIEAVKRGIVSSATASDINRMPLEKGRENALSQGVDIDFILSDGFDSLEGLGITSAAVCGMGGELITKMILRSTTAKGALLILQPMSAQEELRKALWDNGYEILTERFVGECGKFYVLMAVKFTGKPTEYGFSDTFLGKIRPNTHSFAKYCEKVCAGALKRRLGIIARGESTDDIDGLISFCQAQITSL